MVGGDFDGDGHDDLAIGFCGEDEYSGTVVVLPGSVEGVTSAGSQAWTQDSSGVADQVEPGDAFGGKLTFADFDGDDFADLAVGAWGESVGPSGPFAGAVNVLYGSSAGLGAADNQLWRQGRDGIGEQPELSDYFGFGFAHR